MSPALRTLAALTVANIRSFVRDRAALFWTFAFPILFVVLFGTIFSGGGDAEYDVGWVDEDGTPAATQLHDAFAQVPLFALETGARDALLSRMRDGDLRAVIVVPAGYGESLGAPPTGSGPAAQLTLFTDPSAATTSQTIQQVVGQVIGGVNQALSGQPPQIGLRTESLQTVEIGAAAFFVPSILAMALMQVGVFAAIPLVQQREKLILKRLNATPLPRWTLVGSNVIVRLLIAAAQTVIILAIGIALLGVEVTGNPLVIAGFVVLGALTFTSIGYVIASFARTEEAANGMTSIVQFPLMFLSGIFFPLEVMPEWLRGVATFLPLTYLGDALRQTMVGGTPFAPLGVDAIVLVGWLAVTLAISARYFRWQ